MNCFTNTVLPGCYNDGVNPPVSVGIHYINDNQGNPAMVVADVNGDPISGADASNTTIGACPTCAPLAARGPLAAWPHAPTPPPGDDGGSPDDPPNAGDG